MSAGPFAADGQWDPTIPLPVLAIGPGVPAWQTKAVLDLVADLWPGSTVLGRDGFVYVWDGATDAARVAETMVNDAALDGRHVPGTTAAARDALSVPDVGVEEPARANVCPCADCERHEPARGFPTPNGVGGHLAKAHPGWREAALAAKAAGRPLPTWAEVKAARAAPVADVVPMRRPEPAEDIPPGLPSIDELEERHRARAAGEDEDPDGLLGRQRDWQPGEGPIDHYRRKGSGMHRAGRRRDDG